MALIFNQQEISSVVYNGVALSSIVYNGTEVWGGKTWIVKDGVWVDSTIPSYIKKDITYGSISTVNPQNFGNFAVNPDEDGVFSGTIGQGSTAAKYYMYDLTPYKTAHIEISTNTEYAQEASPSISTLVFHIGTAQASLRQTKSADIDITSCASNAICYFSLGMNTNSTDFRQRFKITNFYLEK